MRATTDKPLPPTGMIFCGSYLINSPATPGQPVYAADISDSKSIASTYNEPSTVLDFPRRAPQSEVYTTIKANPAFRFAAGQMVQVQMEPERRDGSHRVRDLDLFVRAPSTPGAQTNSLKTEQFELRGDQGELINNDGATLAHVVAALAKIVEANQDPYVTVHLDERMNLYAVRQLCRALAGMETDQGIRIEPPPPGDLYYRAFLPPDAWRDPANRIRDPRELHLTQSSESGEKITGTLKILHESNAATQPVFPTSAVPVSDGNALASQLAAIDTDWIHPLLVFADADIPYGQLRQFLLPILATHKDLAVFVILEKH